MKAKSESSYNTLLNQYFRKERFYCYYELKVADGKYFPFSKIEENQDEGLPALEKGGLVWKLSDEDSRKKPCDGFCLPPLPAYLIIRMRGSFYFIPYGKIIEMKRAGEKGITLEECFSLADKVVHS